MYKSAAQLMYGPVLVVLGSLFQVSAVFHTTAKLWTSAAAPFLGSGIQSLWWYIKVCSSNEIFFAINSV